MNSTENSTKLMVLPSNGVFVIFTAISLISISIIGMIISFLTVFIILINKSLHTHSFIFICASGIGSFFIAIFYITRAIDYFGLFNIYLFPIKCLLKFGNVGLFAIPFHSLMASFVAIDRLLMVVTPHRYRQFGWRYRIVVLTVSTFIPSIIYSLAYVSLIDLTSISCIRWKSAVHWQYAFLFNILNFFFCFFISASYFCMLLCFRFRHKFYNGQSSGFNQNQHDTFSKQQLAMMPAIKMMMFTYLASGVSAELAILIGVHVGWIHLTYIGSILKDLSSLVEGSSLLIRSKKFRDCCLRLIGGKTNAVAVAVCEDGNKGERFGR